MRDVENFLVLLGDVFSDTAVFLLGFFLGLDFGLLMLGFDGFMGGYLGGGCGKVCGIVGG